MIIGLDFDGTITADPVFWAAFVRLLRDHGHDAAITTYRSAGAGNEDVEQFASDNQLAVYYTDAQQKATCFKADVWIDDMPELCPIEEHIHAQSNFLLEVKERSPAW